MPNSDNVNDERAALDLLLRGYQISRMLRLIADLGIADRIAPDGQMAILALAAACDARSQPLLRVLRALATFNVFTVTAEGIIAHTPRSRLLRTDTPNSLYHSARFWTAPGSWAAWGELEVAMTGAVPHVAAWNMSRFDYLRSHFEEARGFDAMMANSPDSHPAAIAAAYDFSGVGLIVDVGGGHGAVLRQVLSRFPASHGLLLDRDDVVRAIQAPDLLEGRIKVVGGSFFDAIPSGGDIYMLTRVLHDWPDEDCLNLLRVCRRAMRRETVLLIGDQILEPDPMRGRPIDYLVDVQMMAMFGDARERTKDEFAGLLSASGFTLRKVLPTQSSVWLIEARAS
jgi:O-methyltransferase domain